jgi:hypothetical protein
VQAVAGPATANGGDTINVSWRVANIGPNATDATSWIDRLVLSPGTVYNPATAILLGNIAHTGAIAANGNYVGQASVQVPNGISGTYNIITDATSQVYEKGHTQNNTGVSVNPITVAPVPSGNLAVTNVAAPPTAVPGVQQQITWTVQNTGTGTARAPWADNVYLSTDGTLNGATYLATVYGATYLATVPHNFDLAPDAIYTASATVVLPDRADGNYKILVVPDANNQVYEPNRSASNNGTSPLALASRSRAGRSHAWSNQPELRRQHQRDVDGDRFRQRSCARKLDR